MIRQLITAVVALIGLAPQVAAQQIVGPTSLAEHRLATYTVVGPDGKTAVEADFGVHPADRADLVSISGQAVVTAKPGPITITAAAVIDGRPRLLQVLVTCTGATPQPQPPAPTPTPPQPPRPPEPPPAPAWGPLARIVVLYESSEVTGREPWYSQAVRDALNATAPVEAGYRAWRIFDRDLDVSGDPVWVAPTAAAKAHGPNDVPTLFAFDARGQIRTLPMHAGVSPTQTAAAIRALGEAR
jgi:hypothetical protein